MDEDIIKRRKFFTLPNFWKTIGYIFLSIWASISIVAFVFIIFSSLKTNQELFANLWALPKKLNFENYINVWRQLNIGTYFKNSLIVVPISTIVVALISAPCAYVITRTKFKFREALGNFIILGMGVPFQLVIIPLYLLMVRLNLTNNLIGLIIIYIAGSVGFTTFILTGYVKNLPIELEEAALIDGSSAFNMYSKIVFPLMRPGLMTVSIFNFVFLWNEYFVAIVLMRDAASRPISLGLYSLQVSMLVTGNFVGLYAGILMVIIPIMIIFFILSELIMGSLTAGAIKG